MAHVGHGPESLWELSLLAEREWKEQVAAVNDPKKRTLCKRDTNESVNKKIKDNFPATEFTEYNTDVVVNEKGNNLRQQLTEDFRSNRDGNGPSMGLFYYRDRRIEFSGISSTRHLLVVVDPTEEVTPDLVMAMREFRKKPCNCRPISEYLRDATWASHKECIGILRLQADINPNNGGHLQVSIDMCDWALRLGLPENMSAECIVMHTTWDNHITTQYLKLRSAGVTITVWFASSGHLVKLIGDYDDFATLVAARGKWSLYSMVLQRVVTGTTLGRKMWGFVLEKVIIERVAERCLIFVEILRGKHNLNKDVIDREIKLYLDEVREWDGIDMLPKRRMVTNNYRGIIVEQEIFSLRHQAEKAAAFVTRSRAAEAIYVVCV